MISQTIFPLLNAIVLVAVYPTFVNTRPPPAYCYKDDDGCGPNTASWPDLCRRGRLQSPINLHEDTPILGKYNLRTNGYDGSSFRLFTNGHRVMLDFPEGDGPNSQNYTFRFPDPTDVNNRSKVWDYRFSHVHFHFGEGRWQGSEHTIKGEGGDFEVHIVHYKAKFRNIGEAIGSGEGNAIAILAVIVRTQERNSKGSLEGYGARHETMVPLVKWLPEMRNRVAVNNFNPLLCTDSIDFSPLFTRGSKPMQIYSYQGSLTTPGCNEIVSWFVVKRPAYTAIMDLLWFHYLVKDSNGHFVKKNYRGLQERHGRKITLSDVYSVTKY